MLDFLPQIIIIIAILFVHWKVLRFEIFIKKLKVDKQFWRIAYFPITLFDLRISYLLAQCLNSLMFHRCTRNLFIIIITMFFLILEREAVSASVGTWTALQVDDREGTALCWFTQESNSSFTRWEEMCRIGQEREELADITKFTAEASEKSTDRGELCGKLSIRRAVEQKCIKTERDMKNYFTCVPSNLTTNFSHCCRLSTENGRFSCRSGKKYLEIVILFQEKCI